MIRTTIVVWEQCLINQAYEEILKIETFQVIKIVSNMKDEVPQILLNVIYNNSIIGEIVIRQGEKPANYYPVKFLTNLSGA